MDEIVRLNPGEGHRLRALRLRALRDAPDAFAATYEENARRADAEWEQQVAALPTFVAVQEGEDVGMVRGALHRSPDDEDMETLYLISMWVDPRARGRGLGAALITALVDFARTAGFRRILLDVADDNAAAVRLYARCGFEPTGIRGSLPPPRTHVLEHQRELCLSQE